MDSRAEAVSFVICLNKVVSTKANILTFLSSRLLLFRLGLESFVFNYCTSLAEEFRNKTSWVSACWITRPSSRLSNNCSLPYRKISASTKIMPILVMHTWEISKLMARKTKVTMQSKTGTDSEYIKARPAYSIPIVNSFIKRLGQKSK